MPKATARANARKSMVRAHIEHVFAHQKDRMGLFVCNIGLKRAEAKIGLANLAYNFQRLCAAVTNWSTEAAGIAQLRRSKTLPPVAFDPFGDGRWEDVHRGALSTRAAGVPC